MSCNFCNADIFIKTVQYSMPMLAPATKDSEHDRRNFYYIAEKILSYVRRKDEWR